MKNLIVTILVICLGILLLITFVLYSRAPAQDKGKEPAEPEGVSPPLEIDTSEMEDESIWFRQAQDTSWRNYKSTKVYRNVEYGFQFRYPDTLSPEITYDTVYDKIERRDRERVRIAFFTPQDIARIKLRKDTIFYDVFARKIEPQVNLETWLQKKLLLPEFKEFKRSRDEAAHLGTGDFLGEIVIGKNKDIRGYLYHNWAQAIGDSFIFIKHKDVMIEIGSSQPGAEYTFFFEDPVAQMMLSSFEFIETK